MRTTELLAIVTELADKYPDHFVGFYSEGHWHTRKLTIGAFTISEAQQKLTRAAKRGFYDEVPF